MELSCYCFVFLLFMMLIIKQGRCIGKNGTGIGISRRTNSMGCMLRDDSYAKSGTQFLTGDCSEKCNCSDGVLTCKEQGCPENTECSTKDGEHKCHCQEGFHRYGDSCIRVRIDYENLLRQQLFSNYSFLPIPVKNAEDVLNVTFQIALDQILEVDLKDQLLKSKIWVKQVWEDHKLRWHPKDFGDIEAIKIPSSYIWLPDILIYNNANGSYDVQTHTWPTIHHTGIITWFPPAVYQSACKIDVRYFPFDEQICDLKFGSWTYDVESLDLIPISEYVVEHDFTPNDEWRIMDAPCKRHQKEYPCCENEYVDITCSFVLQRQPVYHFAYLLIPCALISFSIILVFYLPPDMSEKMSLCTSVMLSMTWFMLLVTQRIPPNALNTPLIVQYLLFSLGIVVTSLVYNVIIIHMKNRRPICHPMPVWARMIFLMTLPRYVGLRTPVRWQRWKQEQTSDIRKAPLSIKRVSLPIYPPDDSIFTDSIPSAPRSRRHSEDSQQGSGSGSDAMCNTIMSSPPLSRRKIMQLNARGSSPKKGKATGTSDNNNNHPRDISRKVLVDLMENAHDDISYMQERFEAEQIIAGFKEDWKVVAMVIDRIFLILYIVFLVLGTLLVILDAPLALDFFNDYIFNPQGDRPNWIKNNPNKTME